MSATTVGKVNEWNLRPARRTAAGHVATGNMHGVRHCWKPVVELPKRNLLERFCYSLHGSTGNSGCREALLPVGLGAGCEERDEEADEFISMANAGSVAFELGVGFPVWPIERIAESEPKTFVRNPNGELAVSTIENLIGDDVGEAESGGFGVHAGKQCGRRERRHAGEKAFEKRYVDPGAFAGALTAKKRGEDGLAGEKRRKNVGDRERRLADGRTGKRARIHQAAEGLDHQVVPGLGGVRAEATDRGVDQGRLGELLVSVAESVHHAGPEVLHKDVGLGDVRVGLGLIGLEVEGNAGFVAIEAEPVGAIVPVERRAPLAGLVAGAWLLDLGDFGAEVTKHHRAKRACDRASEIEDPDAGER